MPALTWDFARQLAAAGNPGATTSYYDEACQSLYVAGGQIRTRIAEVDDGQWQNIEPEAEIAISPTGVSVLDIEHHYNGAVWGSAQHGSDVVLLLYLYMADVSPWLSDGQLRLQPDNPIKAGSITLVNGDSGLLGDDIDSLFSPGNRLRIRFSAGDSEPYDLGLLYIESSPFSDLGDAFTYLGRSAVGFYLAGQTFDELTAFSGTRAEVFTAILTAAGVPTKQMRVKPDTAALAITFEPDETIFAGILKLTETINWYIDDTPDGVIVIGDDSYMREQVATTGIHTFSRGAEVFSRDVARDAGSVYSRVCVRRQGENQLRLYAPVPNFGGWNIGARRTFYQDVPDTATQAEMEAVRDQLVEGMQYSGVVEVFDGPIRPWLQIGDVASIVGADARLVGIISELQHTFGRRGYRTQLTITSGGTINNPDNPATVATKYRGRMGGANRQRRYLDLLLQRGERGTTGAAGTPGVSGDPGQDGSDGADGASAYEVWLSLGNTGTEADFLAYLAGQAAPIGSIRLWPTATPPAGWILCDGQAIDRTTYADLFAVIGTDYGIGDGSTTFNLPTLPDPATGVSYTIKA